MKDIINILFVCGYGVGSSAIAASILKKGLDELEVRSEVKHTAVGEMESMNSWSDIIVISTKLAEGIKFEENKLVIRVVNVMDGKGIAKIIRQIAEDRYQNAINCSR